MNISKRFFSLFSVFLVASFLFFPVFVSAQIGDPGCDPDDPLCPIDGGVVFLIIAAIGIAVKKYYDLRKKQSLSTLP